MEEDLDRGAQIVIRNWIRLKPWENLLIVTCDDHMKEAMALKQYALKRTTSVDLMIVEKKGIQVGVFFDKNEKVFDGYKAIIGATNYSLVTTLAAKRAIKRGSKFLSLPLSTNNGISMLSYDFMTMDTKKSKMMAQVIMKYLNFSSVIHVRTKAGTNLHLYKQNRNAGFFNGVVKDGKGYSSASIEVYVPIEETKSEGVMVVDGSLGYIGKAQVPTKIQITKGSIIHIQETETGRELSDYLRQYKDPRMYVAGEFGIGLNSYSKCAGNCYIEDESAYGTFHIGFGRNLALGGMWEATGHFDLVCKEPDIYVDNRQIMQDGKIIIPEPEVY
ncbi:MAG: peptidase [Lachnospiraceae bacterium]